MRKNLYYTDTHIDHYISGAPIVSHIGDTTYIKTDRKHLCPLSYDRKIMDKDVFAKIAVITERQRILMYNTKWRHMRFGIKLKKQIHPDAYFWHFSQ